MTYWRSKRSFFPFFSRTSFPLSSLVHFYQFHQPSLHPSRADFCSICPDLFPPVNSQTPRWLTGCRTDSKWNGMTPVEREGGAQGLIREEEEKEEDAPMTHKPEDKNKSQRCVELVRNLWEITAWQRKSCNWISLTRLTGSTFRCCVQRQIVLVKYVSAKPHMFKLNLSLCCNFCQRLLRLNFLIYVLSQDFIYALSRFKHIQTPG